MMLLDCRLEEMYYDILANQQDVWFFNCYQIYLLQMMCTV